VRHSESSDDLSVSSSLDKTLKQRSNRDTREASSGGGSAKDDKDRKDTKRRSTTPDGGESPKEPSPATCKELPQLTATVKREPAGDREPAAGRAVLLLHRRRRLLHHPRARKGSARSPTSSDAGCAVEMTLSSMAIGGTTGLAPLSCCHLSPTRTTIPI